MNNAAYQMAQPGGLLDISTEQLDRVMRTNLYALFWMCQKALPHLSRGSCIINTSSVQASSPSTHLLDYATTKAGIANFTRGLASSLAADGIRVNAVAPGPIWTPLIPATMGEEQVEDFGAQTPLGRAGQPAELAPTYVFLASPEAGYVTGEVLAVTGGMPVQVWALSRPPGPGPSCPGRSCPGRSGRSPRAWSRTGSARGPDGPG
ncbi:MAG: SDR family oxidoreductase [Nocardioidaceae bacterium]